MTTGRLRLIVDANVFVYGVVDPAARAIRGLLVEWQNAGAVFHLPSLWRYEVTNALYRNVVGKVISDERSRQALDEILGFPVEYYDDRLLHAEATTIARRLGAGAAYDAHYLALTQRLDLPFFTADSRLYNAAHRLFPKIELVPIE